MMCGRLTGANGQPVRLDVRPREDTPREEWLFHFVRAAFEKLVVRKVVSFYSRNDRAEAFATGGVGGRPRRLRYWHLSHRRRDVPEGAGGGALRGEIDAEVRRRELQAAVEGRGRTEWDLCVVADPVRSQV